MELDFGIIPRLIALSIIFFFIYVFLYRKFIYSVIDPLLVFVFTTSFASVLVIQVIPDLLNILHFFCCQIALWLGFMLAYALKKQKKTPQKNDLINKDIILLKYTTYVLLFIYLLSNLIIAQVKGFALLSDSPSSAKVAYFQEGFGIFRKINWGVGTFISTSLIFLFLQKKRHHFLYLLGIVVIFTALEGSKSSLLRIVVSLGIVFYHPAFLAKRQILAKFNRYMPLALLAVMSIFFTVLLKENEGIDNTLIAFIRRLLYSADIVIFYYNPLNIDFFSKFSLIDYISRLTNPILGFFRLQPYQEALGNVMVENTLPAGVYPDVIVGPNTPFYIEGRIYFGFFGAIPYSLLVGFLYYKLRDYYFSIISCSAFIFVFIASFLQLASAMLVDVNLAITQTFDLVFFVLPIFIIMSFILTGKLVHYPIVNE